MRNCSGIWRRWRASERVSARRRDARSAHDECGDGLSQGGRLAYRQCGVDRESVTNGVLTLAGADDLFQGDVIPDLGSSSSMFNIGSFSRWGYLASVSQTLGDN